MTNRQGDFIWYELLTSDADAAAEFYGKVVGWTTSSANHPDVDYRFFWAGAVGEAKGGVGGYMQITPDMAAGGARPAWLGYIAVDDVDASVESIKAAGGSVTMPASDLEGVGRMAMVTDPQGAPFYIMRGLSDETSYSFAAYEPTIGHCAWNELSTTDPEAAKAFYGAQFGWSKNGDLDMGPMGKYEFLQASGGRFNLGAVMPKMPEMPVSTWNFYFRVPDIDVALAAVKAGGGTILQEPMEIPGGEYSFNAMDPQGAAFGLVGARK